MRYLSLFSGIEAATTAWHPLGWECAAVSEIEPFPCSVLKHHYPDVPNLGDVTKITEEDIKELGHIDVVVFGSPCQDLSVAGHRKGLINADGTVTRSGLFFTAINIARWSGARFWLWENVPGAFSSNKGRDFAAVVEFMAGLDEVPVPAKGWGTEGVAVGDNGLLEWCVLDAQWFGVAQRRRRVFALADLGDWSNRPPILLEPESLRRDSPPSREAGEGVAHSTAPCLTSSGRGVERTGDTRGQDPVVATFDFQSSGEYGTAPVAATLSARDYKSAKDDLAVTHSLRGEGFDASEDGTGRGTPLVPVSIFQDSEFGVTQYDSAGTLRAGRIPEHQMVLQAVDAWHAPITFGAQMSAPQVDVDMVQTLQAKNPMAMAYSIMPMNSGKDYKARETDVAQPLMTSPVGGNQGGDFIAQPVIGWPEELTVSVDLAGTIQRGGDGGCHDGVMTSAMQVRRLTPTECERLQGFPDGYTDIPWRKQPTSPDGPRYKALGNSMAVPVMRWIGNQIQKAIDHENQSTPTPSA